MAEPAERQRTLLRAPRVDFDLSALALGAIGYLAYQWTWPALASLLQINKFTIPPAGQPSVDVPAWHVLRWDFWHRLVGWMNVPFTSYVESAAGAPDSVFATLPKDGKVAVYKFPLGSFAEQIDASVPVWKLVVTGAVLLVLWSILAGAISRVYAVRIARDESIGAGDGVAFALSNLKQFLLAPLFVATAAALFLGIAALAGAGSAVPGAGPFLEIVLHPLALVAGLVVLVFAVGGVFGFPIMQAALATERNGTLDAISRTFSYVFTRPLSYLVSISLVTVVAGVITAFGTAFIVFATNALMFGASWNTDAAGQREAVNAMGTGAQFATSSGGLLGWPTGLPEQMSGLPAVWVYVSWAFTALALVVVNGYVLSYFVGGLTDTYFLLRRDVDGIDDSEVYVEGADATLGAPLPGEPASLAKP